MQSTRCSHGKERKEPPGGSGGPEIEDQEGKHWPPAGPPPPTCHPEAMDRVVLISAAATATPEAIQATRHAGEALGHDRYTEAGAAFFEDVLPGVFRLVRSQGAH